MEDIMDMEGMAEKLEERQNETNVYTVDDAQVAIMKSDPPQISITAEGTVRTTGWSKARLEPHFMFIRRRTEFTVSNFWQHRPTVRRAMRLRRSNRKNTRRKCPKALKAFGFTPKQTKWNFSRQLRTMINKMG